MKKVIVTGACGFIGTCLCRRLFEAGCRVTGIDNLSRAGSEINAEELKRSRQFTFVKADLSDTKAALRVFEEIGPADAVFHFAGQVAVTTSYVNRLNDFRGNAATGFNVIESVKRFSPGAYCVYASTNKVFGHIVVEKPVGLERPLDPCTPYGVSKAVGELYFTEYGRPPLGLSTCCFRQSCIYGHHQFGVEDQGWVAWFAIANLLGVPVTIYGDGKQVRDLLYIEDLVDLYLEAWEKRLTGVYPVGGGLPNAISLMEGIELIRTLTGRDYRELRKEPSRPGDQPYFVADLAWAKPAGLTWSPRTGCREGLGKMISWIRENEAGLRKLHRLA